MNGTGPDGSGWSKRAPEPWLFGGDDEPSYTEVDGARVVGDAPPSVSLPEAPSSGGRHLWVDGLPRAIFIGGRSELKKNQNPPRPPRGAPGSRSGRCMIHR